MKNLLFALFTFGIALQVSAQKYMTQTGTIEFFSEAALENIEAINNQVSAVLDSETGVMEVSLLMKAFSFDKALMQHHFNDRYVESHKFPKSTFKGQIQDMANIELSAEPVPVKIKGNLTLHGETNEVMADGTLQKTDDGQLHGTATFFVNLEAYKVEIPSGVRNKVAEDIEIKIKLELEEL